MLHMLHQSNRNVRRSGAAGATVILALVLGACLAGAYLFVRTHKGLSEAQANGAALIEQVAQKGLDSVLGRETITRYYLLEESREEGPQPAGFYAIFFEPLLHDQGGLEYSGGKISYLSGSNEGIIRTKFQIRNDLSAFKYMEIPKDIFQTVTQTYQNGKLQIETPRGRLPSGEVPPNLVPPCLMDVFAALTLEQKISGGAAFAFMQQMDGRFPILRIWVKPGGEVPPEIRQAHPAGTAGTLAWIQGGETIERMTYYGPDHLPIWQENPFIPDLTMRLVTRDELLKLFPEAQADLEGWLGRGRRLQPKPNDPEEMQF